MRGVPSQYFVVLCELVGTNGAAMLADVGLSAADILVPDRWIDHQIFIQAVQRAYALTGNEALGLEFGERLNISSHTALGFAVMNSETLEQAITLVLRYNRIITFDVELDLTIEGDQAYLTLQDNSENSPHPGFTYESLFAALNSSIRFLLQRRDLPVWFDIAAAPPAYANRYYDLLGPRVRFNQRRHRLGCPTSLLQASISGANPGLVKIYESQCQTLLAQMDQNASLTDKLRALLENCEGAFPSHDSAAALLAMSSRTLRRRLREEDSSFQQLLDEVRMKRALRYLRETSLPLNSIAYLLGFNDASNFRRAFLRWTGRKPLHFRN